MFQMIVLNGCAQHIAPRAKCLLFWILLTLLDLSSKSAWQSCTLAVGLIGLDARTHTQACCMLGLLCSNCKYAANGMCIGMVHLSVLFTSFMRVHSC